MHNIREKIRNWSIKHAEGPHAKRWLAAFSFAESSFFPIPVDVILIAILLGNKAKQWLRYVLITTGFSVIGGIFGYIIGAFLFEAVGNSIISFYNLGEEFGALEEIFSNNAFWAIFTAAFTPIPYKIFTIAAGVFHINLVSFIAGSLLGRGVRFLIVGVLMKTYGRKISGILYKYFSIISIVLVLIVIILLYSFL
ncbi:MAG TPA: DedA family protein [Ignavibacteria bacterium]|nr:DedA family protein [Ignavibacteria bacterium]